MDGYIEQPPGTLPRATECWAFLAVDPKDQNEGVAGMMTRHGWVPMIGFDKKRINELRPQAQAFAKQHGITLRLVRFTTREDVETIEP